MQSAFAYAHVAQLVQGDVDDHGSNSAALLPGCMRSRQLSMQSAHTPLLQWRSLS